MTHSKHSNNSADFDVLTTHATQLRDMLNDGTLTSVDIVNQYLAQIEKHNTEGLGLRAIISVAPRDLVTARASALDAERAQGETRGPLHGTPIIVKDAFMTAASSGMPTSAGAAAFANSFAKRNASIIERLEQQGLIVIGKASLSEFCGIDATAGWNGVKGQTQSAFIRGGVRKEDVFYGRSTPGGSSSGSGVGVSAGFAPLSLGTETAGSVCMPANRAGLYALKATHGSMPMDGVFVVTRDHDCYGGMAKSPEDLSLLMDVFPGRGMDEAAKKVVQDRDWSGISVGFVDPTVWKALQFENPDGEVEQQILKGYEWAMDQIRQRGGKVVYPVELPSSESLWWNGKSVIRSTSFAKFYARFEEFCAQLEDPPVHSLAELIEFDKKNPAPVPPPLHESPNFLEENLAATMPDADAAAAIAHGRRLAGPEGIDRALATHNVDIILGAGDCSICVVAALAGYPAGVVPMGYLQGERGMGQPQGLMMIGSANGEPKMLKFMNLWQDIVGDWEVPLLLR